MSRHVLVSATLLSLSTGCSGGDDDKSTEDSGTASSTPTTSTTPTPSTTTTADSTAPGPECPWVGTYELTATSCGSSAFAYDAEWAAVYSDAEMVLSTGQDGRCDVAFTWGSATCSETEAWAFTPAVDSTTGLDVGEVGVDYLGITECAPAGCTIDQAPMGIAGSACAVGDRTSSDQIVIDDSVADQLIIEGLLDDGDRHDCAIGLNTTWRRR